MALFPACHTHTHTHFSVRRTHAIEVDPRILIVTKNEENGVYVSTNRSLCVIKVYKWICWDPQAAKTMRTKNFILIYVQIKCDRLTMG